MKMNRFSIRPALLQRFAEPNTNVTTDGGLSVEMKTYYDKTLLETAEPNLVHNQFGMQKPIPKGNGKVIEFRCFDDLPKKTTELVEGVTPDGKKLNVTSITAEVGQYGDYVAVSDLLDMTAIDPVIVQATKKIAKQAGMTLDTLTRDVLAGGTNVQYAEGQVSSRSALTAAHKLTVDAIRRAVRTLKTNNVDPFDECYVAIIHPDVAYDLMSDPKWVNVKTYSDPDGIYRGEIGKIENVRFVESTEAKKFVSTGSEGIDVYATLVIGDGAYGVTEVTGGGLQTFVKPKGSGGTSDPLDQRSTIGWKATHTAKILSQKAMVRIETASTFNDHIAN